MSFVSQITTPIASIPALKRAVEALQKSGVNCKLVENATPRTHSAGEYGQRCEYVLQLQGPYDVGFKKQKDGTYSAVLDTYRGYVGSHVGVAPSCSVQASTAAKEIGKLMQQYSYEVSVMEAEAEGYTVMGSETDNEGNVHLKVHVG